MGDTNKMRDEFEAAFAQETVRRAVEDGLLELNESAELLACTICVMAKDRDGDTYGEVHFASAWWAWQASRQAVVVELPSFDGYRDFVVRELQAAFTGACEAQGLRVGVRT